MNRLRVADAENLSVAAEAGIILQEVVTDSGLILPLALGSQNSCRIGGNISTKHDALSSYDTRSALASSLIVMTKQHAESA